MVAICTSYFDNLTCQKGEYMEIESPTECKNNPTFISRSEAYFDECDIFYAEFNEDKDFNEGNIYFEFNVNFTSIPDPNYFIDIFSKNNSENRLSIFIAPTGDLVFKTYTPNRNIEVKKNLAHKGMGFGTNEWHSVMYEWDLKEQYIWVYIDGVLVLEMELPDTSFQNKFDVYTIGADWMVRNQAYATIRAVEITNSKRLGYLPIAPKLYIHKRFNFGD